MRVYRHNPDGSHDLIGSTALAAPDRFQRAVVIAAAPPRPGEPDAAPRQAVFTIGPIFDAGTWGPTLREVAVLVTDEDPALLPGWRAFRHDGRRLAPVAERLLDSEAFSHWDDGGARANACRDLALEVLEAADRADIPTDAMLGQGAVAAAALLAETSGWGMRPSGHAHEVCRRLAGSVFAAMRDARRHGGDPASFDRHRMAR